MANQQHDDPKHLSDCFTSLTKLEQVHITYKEPFFQFIIPLCETLICFRQNLCFKNDILRRAWISRYVTNCLPRIHKCFITLLEALRSLPHELKHFSHDQLPTSFFFHGQHQPRDLLRPLEGLTTLHLTLATPDIPEERFWEGPGDMFRSVPNLKNLRFGFSFSGQDGGDRKVMKW